MKSLVSWWVKNPIAANLAMISLIVAGLVSYFFAIEKEPFPTVKMATMDIRINWPGAGPRDIEDQIIVRFEDAVKNVEGIKTIISRALEGRAFITIRGKERVDRREFAEEIREKINSVNGLPSDTERPVVTEKTNRKSMIRIALHGHINRDSLTGLSHEIRRQVASLPLISTVDLKGEGRYEIAIEVTEQAMSTYGVTIEEVANAIKSSSINTSTGTVRDEAGVLMLSVRNRAEQQQEFEDIIIRQGKGGESLYLRDVATVVDGLADSRFVSTFDGEPAILIDVMNSSYMNIPKMSKYVNDYVNKKNLQLPEGVKLTIWSDWNEAYQGRLMTIFSNAVSGLILVFILLLLFLQPKVAFWVSAGIATAFAASFALLPSFDVSLNMISLFAFLMVIGIVVDDAIVIGESVHLSHEAGLHGEEAAIEGVTQVAKPVLFGVLTTMVVFAPMAFLPGSTAEFTRAIATVVILSLAFSLFEALFILPSHLRHLQGDKPSEKPSKLAKIQKRIASSLDYLNERFYIKLLQWCYKHKQTTIAIFVGAVFIGFSLLNNNYINQSFMPQIADDKIRLAVTLPTTATHERMLQVLQQIQQGQKRLLEHVEQLPSPFLVDHDYTRLSGTQITSEIKLVQYDKRAMTINEASAFLQEYIGDIPDAEEIELKSTLNTLEPRVGFSFNSQDIEALKEGVADFKQHLATYSGIYLLRDNMDKGSQELVFTLKPGTEALGINLRDISRQVKQAYFGQEVQRLPKVGGDVRVKVMYSRFERESIDTLQNLKIRSKDGRTIPLMAIVDVEIRAGIQRIIRRDGFKSGYVYAEYSGEDQRALNIDVRENYIPEWQKRHPQVSFGRGERMQEENEFRQTVIVLEGLALMVAYMLMAIAFRSYSQPLLIMSAIPFGVLGALMGHLIHDISFGMFSMLGILAASGVVINDNLVLVDAINRFREKGLSFKDAVFRACRTRFRPIILTSMTTFIGLMPMLAAESVQAKFLVPMVVSLAYGVLAATIVTLIFVPCVYWLTTDCIQGWQKLRTKLIESK
ncbi:efflux RND transporter permease subunit [Psychrosphaera sp. B3R10]|uniref:efflux RND transporter permease subunit n=1 Tax=unclassified Psychrosphaera TaxID=2641570 RepID=UPI001C08B1D7|nr:MULTISPECIES: efflux RND transporter permease subunit [unclassified Psychrosphaera]MBU2883457.1 efflux RND transporter permease subunit [Psychrosphaera sp. I2R16]MBU2988018.1 efflux RND transporter permease subunit [Psychrosphaera sp. B3R10]